MRTGPALLMLTALVLAGSVRAQPAPTPPPPPPPASQDVIGSLLDHRGQEPRDEDEPDTAGQPRTAPEPDPTFTPRPAPAPAPAAVRSQITQPVQIEETGKTPDAPLTPRDLAYDARIRSSFASAQGFQGPLEGGWTLTAPGTLSGAVDLYALQIVDRADRLEGVWRDLRRKGALNASGVVDNIQRLGEDLTLRFKPNPNAPTYVATLHATADGRWTGELAEGDHRRSVTLRRSGP